MALGYKHYGPVAQIRMSVVAIPQLRDHAAAGLILIRATVPYAAMKNCLFL